MLKERETFARHTSYNKRAFGIFKKREDLEATIHALKEDGFDMERVSLIARHLDDVEGAKEITEQHGNEAKEGAGIGATTGSLLGGLGGFLVGVGLLAIPGVGPILAAGVGIPALASTLAGAGIGAAAGGIIGALVGLGIPEEKAKVYSARINAGEYLLTVNGADDDLHRIESIMRRHHVEDFEIFGAPDLIRTQPVATTERVETRATVTKTADVDIDLDPVVVIVDKRDEVR